MNNKTRIAERTKLNDAKKAFTRRRAERAVADTTDIARLKELAGHRNKHVTAKAEAKLARLRVEVE